MSSERANHRRWTDGAHGVYEVWYLTWNDPATDHGFWLRYIIEQPEDGHGAPRGELWFARFDSKRSTRTFGIHAHVPYSTVAAAKDPFVLSVGGCRLGHDHAVGQLAGDGHDVRWDLRWEPASETLRIYPDAMYLRERLAPTTALMPNWSVPLSGTLVVDGETHRFDRVPMGQTHLWGKKHGYTWTWAHCNEFDDDADARLELIGGRIHRRGFTTPPLLAVAFDLDGETYRFNQLRHFAVNRARWETGHIQFTGVGAMAKVVGELRCAPESLIAAPYIDPDGTPVYCANTEIGDATVTLYRRSGLRWREHRTVTATRRAHFETGGRLRDPAVVREHILVR